MSLEILTFVILLATVSATITLWQTAARRPGKLKKKFINDLLHSQPIVPEHQPPSAIGERSASLVTEEDKRFFEDFREFAGVVNWWLTDKYVATRWRLQEMPDTEQKLGSISDLPDFARRFAIFYNQVRLGTLEISPGYHYGAETPNVVANIQIEWVRLLNFRAVHEFLEDIALHICDSRDKNSGEYLQAHGAIDRALTAVLWETQHIYENNIDGQDYGELELHLSGPATRYFQRREALREQDAAE